MNLGELKPAYGSNTKSWRRGRGHASGNGKTAGRGHKGQGARSGSGGKAGFEGGQMPLYRRLPKRGFKNTNFKKEYAIINLDDLNKFEDGSEVSLDILMNMGIVKKELCGLKVLGNGTLEKKLDVKASKFSASAKEQIEKLGGKAEVI